MLKISSKPVDATGIRQKLRIFRLLIIIDRKSWKSVILYRSYHLYLIAMFSDYDEIFSM